MQALFDADCRFHVTILEATQNQVMRQMRQIILTMLRVSYEFGVMRPENDPVTREGHIVVAEAIARRDGPKPPATPWRTCCSRNREHRREATGASFSRMHPASGSDPVGRLRLRRPGRARAGGPPLTPV